MSEVSRANDERLHEYLHNVNCSPALIRDERKLTSRQLFWCKVFIAGAMAFSAWIIYNNLSLNDEFDRDRIRAEKLLGKYDALDKQAVDFIEEVEGKKYAENKAFPRDIFYELRDRVKAGDL